MDGQSIDILLVEDEAAHAELICFAFRNFSSRYNLTLASDLEEARTNLAEKLPDLVSLVRRCISRVSRICNNIMA